METTPSTRWKGEGQTNIGFAKVSYSDKQLFLLLGLSVHSHVEADQQNLEKDFAKMEVMVELCVQLLLKDKHKNALCLRALVSLFQKQ